MDEKKRILILGSSGLVGQVLVPQLKSRYEVFTTFHGKKRFNHDLPCNLTSERDLEKVFEVSKPDIIVNLCTIYKNVEYCENNKKLVMAVNGDALKPISKLSNKFNAFLLSISSDYVFDGKEGNYKEDDTVSPINFYGMSKVEGENNIRTIASKYCIVRTSMIYGRNTLRKTLPDNILDGVKEESGFKVIHDQYMSPTYLENFCNMLREVIDDQHYGILHLAGSKKMSRYEFGVKLLNKLNINTDKLIPVKRSEFSFAKTMPKDSSLNTIKAFSLLKEKPEDFEKSLDKCISSITEK